MAEARRTNLRPNSATRRVGPLGTTQLVVLAAGLALVIAIAVIAAYPSVHRQYVEDVGIKRFEQQYGFQSGLVTWQEPGRAAELMWGIVSVTPDGAFARAGVRAGDVPLGSHDRVTELYSALELASSGQAASFEVLNQADAHLGFGAGRRINLLPSK